MNVFEELKGLMKELAKNQQFKLRSSTNSLILWKSNLWVKINSLISLNYQSPIHISNFYTLVFSLKK
jgi:hypothetical protein